MTLAVFDLDDSFARDLAELAVPWNAAPVDVPELLVFNRRAG